MPGRFSAAIDLGSNTTRLLVASPSGQGIKRALATQQTTRLGQGLNPGRLLSPEAVERTVKVLKDYKKQVKRFQADPALAGATAAVREAVDGLEFINRVEREFGFETVILTGEQEADLTSAGVMTGISPEPELALIVDLGGRSTEFILRKNGQNLKTISLALGAVALTEAHLVSDPPAQDEIEALGAEIADVLKNELSQEIREAGQTALIGTAGTVTTLAAVSQGLSVYQPELINNYPLSLKEIETIFNRFVGVSKSERTQIPGLEAERADIILAGTKVIMEIMKFMSINRLTVSDAGLLEGIWLVAAGLKEITHE